MRHAIIASIPFGGTDGARACDAYERKLEQELKAGHKPEQPKKIKPHNILAMLLKSGVKVADG